MSQQSTAFLTLVKTLSFALKQQRLYSEKHPITQETLKNLGEEVEIYFLKHEKLTLGAMQHKLLVDGNPVSDKEAAAHDLAKDLERLGLDGIVLDRGVSMAEISDLVSLMSMRAKSLTDRGGFKKAFEEAKLPHIRLSQGKFQLVEDGEVVVQEGAQPGDGGIGESGEAGTGTASASGKESALPITDIAEVIRRLKQGTDLPPGGVSGGGGGGGGGGSGPVSGMPGVVFGAPLSINPEKIVDQLEKNPKDIVQAALADVEDEVRLEQLIRQTVKLLIDGLLAFLVEQGKDITKALEKLAKELEKGLSGLDESAGFDKLKKKIPGIFEEATDEFRIQMMKRTHAEHPEDVKLLEKMAKKLFKDKDVRERLQTNLTEEMGEVGLSAETIQKIFSKIDETEDKKKKKVSIDAEELEELKRRAALYDATSDGTIDKKLQTLELENKVVRHQKERMDAVIHNMAEGLLIVDEHGKVVLMNPAAEKMLGVKKSDKLGKAVTEGLGAEHVVSMATGNLRDQQNVLSQQVELFAPNDETKRVLNASSAIIENEDGQTVGMVSVLSDITRQKELDDLKTKFVGNVSHELRTPLVAIQKSLALIADQEVGSVTPEQKKFLDIAQRNIERLSRLINDLLDVQRLEAGQMNLKPSTFPVNGLIQHVISTVETWAKDKGVTVKADFPSHEDVELEADPDRLTQVITNLVGNAIKFTPDKGTITVELRKNVKDETLPGGIGIEVGVRDTGVGIEPEDQKKIFDKFVQVSLSQPSGISSSGLGLTITKEIVELHSGRIWVESEPGKGSRFAFRVPLKFSAHRKVHGS